MYTLARALRLRGTRRAFCKLVDAWKACDIVWKDAVSLKLAEMGTWSESGLSLQTFLLAQQHAVVNGALVR